MKIALENIGMHAKYNLHARYNMDVIIYHVYNAMIKICISLCVINVCQCKPVTDILQPCLSARVVLL